MQEITYHKEGDYFIPDLYLEKEDYENDYIIRNKKLELIILISSSFFMAYSKLNFGGSCSSGSSTSLK